MTLYRYDNVTWGGMMVGGIRVKAITDITAPLVLALQEKKGSKKLTTVQLLPMPKHDAPEVYSFEQAELDVRLAKTPDELGRVWRARKMAPHRERLEDLKNDRKEALTAPVEPTPADDFAEAE